MGRGSRAVVSPRPGILAYSSASKQSTSSRTSTGSSTRRSPSPSTRSPSQSSVFSRFVTQSALEYSLAGIAETHQNVPEIAIALMGATGSGKSSFINLVSGSKFAVNNGLKSCTATVQVSKGFRLNGHPVVLIDTPGFDDTERSDIDVLNMVAAFLATSYKQGAKLAGALYFHRISDRRVGGASRKNFTMFRKLCGENALKNVVIVTNMWGDVLPEIGEARETELKQDNMFFKPVLNRGARITRHDNTRFSAERILGLFLDNRPLPLRIQEELVDEAKDIARTDAGEELNRELDERMKKIDREMLELREEIRIAIKEKDEETRRELESVTQSMREQTKKVGSDRCRLESDYKKEKARFEALMQQKELETREETERLKVQYQQEIIRLTNVLTIAATQQEKDQKLMNLDELAKNAGHARANFFSNFADWADVP